MGCCGSVNETADLAVGSQYESLVVSKPAPIALEEVEAESSDTDVPLFAAISSDDDQLVGEPETLTDDELNAYAERLTKPRL